MLSMQLGASWPDIPPSPKSVPDGSLSRSHNRAPRHGGLAEAPHGRAPHALRPPPPRPGHDEGKRRRGEEEPHEPREHVLHHHQHGESIIPAKFWRQLAV